MTHAEVPRDRFYPEKPANIAELVTRADEITRQMYIEPYLSGSERKPEIEAAASTLHVWDVLERCGITPPAWVEIARAASWYWER